jgi:hypothetical protein
MRYGSHENCRLLIHDDDDGDGSKTLDNNVVRINRVLLLIYLRLVTACFCEACTIS